MSTFREIPKNVDASSVCTVLPIFKFNRIHSGVKLLTCPSIVIVASTHIHTLIVFPSSSVPSTSSSLPVTNRRSSLPISLSFSARNSQPLETVKSESSRRRFNKTLVFLRQRKNVQARRTEPKSYKKDREREASKINKKTGAFFSPCARPSSWSASSSWSYQ